jgi:hypothetical protein
VNADFFGPSQDDGGLNPKPPQGGGGGNKNPGSGPPDGSGGEGLGEQGSRSTHIGLPEILLTTALEGFGTTKTDGSSLDGKFGGGYSYEFSPHARSTIGSATSGAGAGRARFAEFSVTSPGNSSSDFDPWDRSPGLGAQAGKIYLATEVGLFQQFNEYSSNHIHGVTYLSGLGRGAGGVHLGRNDGSVGQVDDPVPSVSDFCPWCVGR